MAITRSVRLGDELKLERFPVTPSADTKYTQIGIRSFGKGIFHREKVPGNELSKLRYFEVNPGRLIVSNIMAWEGAIAVSSDQDRDCIASSRFLSYAPSTNIDVNYLNYYFQSIQGKRAIRNTSTGTVLRNQTLSIRDFENLVVPLPDIEEQRRIAARLDELIASAEQVTQRATSEDQKIIDLAIASTDDLLDHWSSGAVSIGQTCTIVNDLVRPGEDPNPAQEFVGLEHIRPHFGERIGARPLGKETGRKFRFAPGDILYGYLRPYLNKVWVADRHGLCSVEQFVLRPNGPVPAELIAQALRGRRTLDQVIALTNDLQLPRLRSSYLMALEIPHIPEPNQAAALSALAKLSQQINRLLSLKQQQQQLASSLRPALLKAAFNGEL